MTAVHKAWWKEACVFQVYPSSFADAKGTGLGNLAGITSKVDYLKDLGVDVLWMSPIYDSPQKDMGYDISDYKQIYAPYGTLEDWDSLRDALHERGMKVMMDLVVNHTSDQHFWFKESRKSRDNPYRSFYHWRPARKGPNGERMPPNNWMCVFGNESAWTWDEATEEYYLRLYVKEQPDLNWDNPEVRKAVWDIMKFWLDRGSDGFRMDVINLISKTPGLPDAKEVIPGQFLQPSYEHTANGPNVHKYLKEMYEEVLSKYDTITVGETPFTHDTKILSQYSRPEEKELQMVFTFELHDIDGDRVNPMKTRKYELQEFKSIIAKYQQDLYESGGWNSLYLGNHDQARSVSRFANDSPEFRARSAKLLATLHNTLCGTVYVYQGDELGMKNVPSTWTIDDLPDVATKMYWQSVLEKRRKEQGVEEPDMSDVLKDVLRKARDNARAPVQWTAGQTVGFTTGKPWMKVNVEDAQEWNAEAEQKDENSVLRYWQRMIAVRKANSVLTYGNFKLIDASNPDIFAYTRTEGDVSALVLLSFADKDTPFEPLTDEVKSLSKSSAKWLIGNYDEVELAEKVVLRPYESRVYLL